uniref:Uncharacterized protein n=1 Tax=Anguilla anguilla TaxID=7936 RepID=A0A0E9RR39_ANGAN
MLSLSHSAPLVANMSTCNIGYCYIIFFNNI